ncbi:MAG: signal peptide peptidase SppA [Gammaproteobacteria bacterium]|nr:signal peptide peptidase SppA [Gammaproteobacteria bacterium]
MMKFFGSLWRFIERLVKAVQVVFFLFIVVFFVAVFTGRSDVAITVPDGAALIIAPDGVLVEQRAGESFDIALSQVQGGQGQTQVRDIVTSLRRAAEDDRIAAVVLSADYLVGGGLSKLQVIADAVAEFKTSGKPVIAMGDSFTQAQYHFVAGADEIYMHDFGFVLIEGFGYYKPYFAEAIEKLNVDVNVFRVGEFKSFVEPYLRNDMSAEDRQNAEKWLNRLWAAYRRDVATARGLEPAVLDGYINNSVSLLREANGDAGSAAIAAGLIDGLKSRQQFRDYMVELVGVDADRSDTFAHIDFRTYLSATDFQDLEIDNDSSIAVIVASGEIVDGEAPPGTIGGDSLARLVRQARRNDEVRAVVLQIDSPGGSMFASEIVLDQLQALQAAGKPYVASMSSTAASGGYYIAMAADEIYAAETTISGSIGVGAIYPTFQRSLESVGVTIDGIGTTPLTGQMSPLMELGDEGRQLFDISVRSAYDTFIGKVAEHRELTPERVDQLARGQIWIGVDAMDVGLVDQLGGIDQAIEAAARLAGLPKDGWDVDYIEKPLSLAEQMLMQYLELLQQLFTRFDSSGTGFLQLLERLRGDLNVVVPDIGNWNDPRGIYYHCLCQIRG